MTIRQGLPDLAERLSEGNLAQEAVFGSHDVEKLLLGLEELSLVQYGWNALVSGRLTALKARHSASGRRQRETL